MSHTRKKQSLDLPDEYPIESDEKGKAKRCLPGYSKKGTMCKRNKPKNPTEVDIIPEIPAEIPEPQILAPSPEPLPKPASVHSPELSSLPDPASVHSLPPIPLIPLFYGKKAQKLQNIPLALNAIRERRYDPYESGNILKDAIYFSDEVALALIADLKDTHPNLLAYKMANGDPLLVGTFKASGSPVTLALIDAIASGPTPEHLGTPSSDNQTPLISAIYSGKSQIASAIIETGYSNPYYDNRQAYIVAKEKQMKKVVTLLSNFNPCNVYPYPHPRTYEPFERLFPIPITLSNSFPPKLVPFFTTILDSSELSRLNGEIANTYRIYGPTALNTADKNGRRLIHHAAMNGYGSTVKKLLSLEGVEYDISDNYGMTPIMLAVQGAYKEGEHITIVDLFLNHNINREHRDNQGRTLFDIAIEYEQKQMLTVVASRVTVKTIEHSSTRLTHDKFPVQNQETEGLCYAYAAARMITGLFAYVLPEDFKMTERDIARFQEPLNKKYINCNIYAGQDRAKLEEQLLRECPIPRRRNYLAIFYYTLQHLKNTVGCKGGFTCSAAKSFAENPIQFYSTKSELPTISTAIDNLCKELIAKYDVRRRDWDIRALTIYCKSKSETDNWVTNFPEEAKQSLKKGIEVGLAFSIDKERMRQLTYLRNYERFVKRTDSDCGEPANHAVTITNWEAPEGDEPAHVTIVNSWGADWGYGGYLRLPATQYDLFEIPELCKTNNRHNYGYMSITYFVVQAAAAAAAEPEVEIDDSSPITPVAQSPSTRGGRRKRARYTRKRRVLRT